MKENYPPIASLVDEIRQFLIDTENLPMDEVISGINFAVDQAIFEYLEVSKTDIDGGVNAKNRTLNLKTEIVQRYLI